LNVSTNGEVVGVGEREMVGGESGCVLDKGDETDGGFGAAEEVEEEGDEEEEEEGRICTLDSVVWR
jgi:hypothetical protein